MQEPLGPRRYDLDWVRIGAFSLLIMYHVGRYYVTWYWHVKSPAASHRLEPWLMLSTPWRLSLLFLVSGIATAYLQSRAGPGFLGSRSFRLLLPLIFGVLVIVPPQSYLEVVEKFHYTGSYFDFYRLSPHAYGGFCDHSVCLHWPAWNHLWYLGYLWLYTVVLYGLMWLAPGLVPALRRLSERAASGAAFLLLPILYLAAARILLSERFPETFVPINDWYSHAVYFSMYLAGFVLAATQVPWELVGRWRWYLLFGAVLSWGSYIWLGGVLRGAVAPMTWLGDLRGVIYGAGQWLTLTAILGLARMHLNRDSAARRYFNAAIFPMYILHQTVIIIAAHALKPAHIAPLPEGWLLVAVTWTTCLAAYELIRRVPILRPLFGVARRSPAGRAAVQVPVPVIPAVNAPVADGASR